MAKFEERFASWEGQAQKQHEEQAGMLHELVERMDTLESDRPAIVKQLHVLESTLAKAEAGVAFSAPGGSTSSGTTEFNRQLDLSIVKIRTQTEISRKEIKKAIGTVILEMELSESQYSIEGKDELSRMHTLRFRGAGGLAENRAKKFLQLQKTGDGWRKLQALDEKGERTELYLDGDKNRKMVKTEILTKKLGAAISGHPPPGKKAYVQRSAGVVSVDFIPVARVIVKGENEITIDWNTLHPIKSIPREEIDKEIKAAPEAGGNTSWG